jgi:GTP cyclohydrolase FolE2
VLAVNKLDEAHHGSRFRVAVSTVLTQRLKGHCTGIPSTLPWRARFSFERRHLCPESVHLDKGQPAKSCPSCGGSKVEDFYTLELETTVFTACPFVLYETDGHQSHTQRTHVRVELDADRPLLGAAVMREITTRLVPVMSNMKIPDEVVQVLKSYAGPTFTEDGAVRVQKILRGVGAEMCPDGTIRELRVKVVSEDSHLAHDVVTTLVTPFE